MKTSYYKKVIDGNDVYYQIRGSGEPLFCFPGWTLSSNSYAPLADQLDLEKVKLIMPDIPGWAGKSPTLEGKTTFTKLTSLLAAFIQSFSFESFSILGYSYGGALVQNILKTSLLPVSKVILISTLCEGGDTMLDRYRKPLELYTHARKHNISEPVIRSRINDIFRLSIERKFPRELVDNPYAASIVSEYFSGNVKAMMESGFSLLEGSYLSDALKNTHCTVIYAKDDMSFIQSSSKKIADFVGEKPVLVKGDHNHLLFYPERTASILRQLF